MSYEKLMIDDEVKIRTINLLKKVGLLIEPVASTIPLPDETDRIFYDTARMSGAILVTGNIRHYPNESNIMTPAEFLSRF